MLGKDSNIVFEQDTNIFALIRFNTYFPDLRDRDQKFVFLHSLDDSLDETKLHSAGPPSPPSRLAPPPRAKQRAYRGGDCGGGLKSGASRRVNDLVMP